VLCSGSVAGRTRQRTNPETRGRFGYPAEVLTTKAVKVPVLIDYTKVPRRYRGLLYKLQRGRWTRVELRWVLRHHDKLPPIVAAVIRQKVRAG
jgi:hypothetical protein